MGAAASVSRDGAESPRQSNNDSNNSALAEAKSGPSDAKDISESKDSFNEHITNPPSDKFDENISRKNIVQPSTGSAPRRKSQVVQMQSGKHKIVTWFENNNELAVGDIVRVTFSNANRMEGFVVERLNDENILVDFGENIKQCHVSSCTLVIKSDELEVGDKVEMKPEDSGLYFIGKILVINADCTLDILMDGDDPDDIERGVNPDNVRKLMSKRGLVVGRWRRAFMMIIAINRFGRTMFKERTSIEDLGPELDHFAFESEHIQRNPTINEEEEHQE